jgi:hypothetical protein
MKNYLLCSVLLCLLFSCSTDSDLNVSDIENAAAAKSVEALVLPENKSNPFDYRGKQYHEILTNYWKQNHFPNSIKDATEQIRFILSQFENDHFTNKSVIVFNDSIVESIMSDPDNNMIQIVQSSDLDSAAQTSIINFLQDLIYQRDQTFTVAYDYIISYEDTIIASNTLDDDEKETMLTMTSISRYSLYSEAERKDRDWDTSAGNKMVKPFFSGNETSIISIIAVLDKII